jgi:hypothetical protein
VWRLAAPNTAAACDEQLSIPRHVHDACGRHLPITTEILQIHVTRVRCFYGDERIPILARGYDLASFQMEHGGASARLAPGDTACRRSDSAQSDCPLGHTIPGSCAFRPGSAAHARVGQVRGRSHAGSNAEASSKMCTLIPAHSHQSASRRSAHPARSHDLRWTTLSSGGHVPNRSAFMATPVAAIMSRSVATARSTSCA